MMLIRPMWIEGESWPGFLMRIAEENSVKGLMEIGRLVGLTVGELLSAEPKFVLTQLGYQPSMNFPIPARWFLVASKSMFPGSFGRSLYTRVCVQCLSTDPKPYIRSSWDQVLALPCQHHTQALAESCAECGKPIDYFRSKIVECSCGSPYSPSIRKEPSVDVTPILTVFDLQIEKVGFRGTFEGSTRQEHLAAIALYKIHTRVREIHGESEIPKRMSLANSFLSTKIFEDLLPWFFDWPNRFIQLVGQTNSIAGQKPSTKLNLTTLYGNEFEKIRFALDERNRRRKHSRAPRGNRLPESIKSIKRNDLIGIRELIDLTGLHYTRLMPWVKAGKFGATVPIVEVSGKTSEKILRARIKPLLEFLSQTTTFNSAGRDIGIDPVVLRYMARDGIFKAISIGGIDYTNRLVLVDVFRWTNSVLLWAKLGRTGTRRYINFSDASTAVLLRMRSSFKSFIESVGTNKLPLKYFGSQPFAINEVYLYQDDLDRWIAHARAMERRNVNL